MCATINILQNLPRGALIRAVLLLSSEEYLYPRGMKSRRGVYWFRLTSGCLSVYLITFFDTPPSVFKLER